MSQSDLFRKSLHPKCWPNWVGFGLLWLVVQILPYRIQIWLGKSLGRLALKFSKRRQKIAQQNIAACYPDMPEEERRKLVVAVAESVGASFIESGMAWFWPGWRFNGLSSIEGLEHLEQARKEGRGVLLLAIHFTPIEICAAFINRSTSIDGFYQRHKNPCLRTACNAMGGNATTLRVRLFREREVRRIVRALKNKRVINYAVDQDYGSKTKADSRVFAPFFGIQALTTVVPAKLVSLTKAKAIFYTTQRLEGGKGYRIKIYPPLESLGELGDEDAARLLNEFVEARVRENPEQYLWFHRRFKTRPPGEGAVLRLRTPGSIAMTEPLHTGFICNRPPVRRIRPTGCLAISVSSV